MDNQESTFSTAKAVVIGAIVVALTIAGSYAYQRHYIEKNLPTLIQKSIQAMTPSPENMPAITKDDHILGDTKAPVKVVIYTDLECPYCKVFHNSVKELEKDYIKDGKVAFIYRNFPLDSLHSKARAEAEASECAAKLGGNDKYWAYVDKIFATTPSNDGLDLNLLPKFAADLGLDKATFESCQKDKAIAAKVNEQGKGGEKAGAQGTPYPIVVYQNEIKGSLGGAMPADNLRKMVDQLSSGK